MSEIDVSKCPYKGGIECHIRDYPILNCADVKIEDCYYKQLQQANKKLEKIKEIIKTDIENEDITLQEFSKMWYFSLSPKGKILQDILNIIIKKKGKGQ